MSPDLDTGPPGGADGLASAAIQGQQHFSLPRLSAEVSEEGEIEIELDDSPASCASSSHVAHRISSPRHAPNANPLHHSSPASAEDAHRRLQSAHTRSSLLPLGQSAIAKPLSNHSPSRPNVRSVSSPLDNRSFASSAASKTPTGKPSVKDLKRRFDQNGSVAASSAAKPQPRPSQVTPRVARPVTKTVNGALVAPASYSGSARDAQARTALETDADARARRSRCDAPSAAPANSQSFASRIGKPRGSVFGKVPTSKSMTQLPSSSSSSSSRHSHQQMSPMPSRSNRPPGLLLGQVSPSQRDASAAGLGIHGIRSPPTSVASHNTPATHHHRSLSGPDAEQPFSSSWHRHNDASRNYSHTTSATTTTSPRSRHRTRSRSDAATASNQTPGSEVSCNLSRRVPSSTSPEPSQWTSKLPVSVRTMSSSTAHTTPPSTRPSSPLALRSSPPTSRISGGNAHAVPRTTGAFGRIKTPTRASTGQRSSPPALASTDRLQAYIASPSPKLSPPLRSSRPRMPVSAANSIGSGFKDPRRVMSYHPGTPNDPTSVERPAVRRKISFGPIDFEQRREHIRLAYSKTIRESEANEERQLAAGRQRTVSDEVGASDPTKRVVSPTADAAYAASIDTAENGPETKAVIGNTQRRLYSSPAGSVGDATVPSAKRSAPAPVARLGLPPLTIRTTIKASSPDNDSPTLGVPGSFPALSSPIYNDEQAMSALSAASETTEFDAEPQTNPPLHISSPLEVPITVVKPPSPTRVIPARQAQYRYPFADETDCLDQSPKSISVTKRPDSAAGLQSIGHASVTAMAFGDLLTQVPELGAAMPAMPSAGDKVGAMMANHSTTAFPRLDAHGDFDCLSDSDAAALDSRCSRQDDDGTTDACTEEETDEGDGPRYRGTDFNLELFSHRSSTCASSDVGALGGTDETTTTTTTHRDAVSSSRLTVPRPRLQNDRFSRQSAWTDFSVDSNDASDDAKSCTSQSKRGSPSFGHVTIFGSRSPGRGSVCSSRDTPSASGTRASGEPRRSSMPVGPMRSPELGSAAGGGSSAPSLSPAATSPRLPFIPSPDHEPPPVPNSASASALDSRTSSAYYDQSHYGSTLVSSEREADNLETPQSPKGSGDESLKSLMSSGAAQTHAPLDDAKERHRLIQRQNVIKELIDTEAVFVRDMNIVEEIYKGTAEACPKLDPKTVKLIFRNSDEIIHFHTAFLKELKEAAATVYVPAGGRMRSRAEESTVSGQGQRDDKTPVDSDDRATSLGPVFQREIESMKIAHEGFLRNSDQAAKRLIQIQQDPTVKVWLSECNEVAKDLTAAWDLDSLLIKPMQRITKYPNLIITLLQHTPHDHPDREALMAAKESLETAIIEVNRTKKNFELVGQIVGRKRKESDVKAGFARAFGKRVDKLQASSNRPPEDQEYAKLQDKFGDDYLRLQVVLRDVEFYTRQVSAYVHEFLQYLSSVELVMRLQPGNYPELESKWVQFNISVRDLEKVALDEHLNRVRKQVIEPFELVIKAYGNPSLAMKKRQKRRLDYERSEQLKRAGKSVDPKLRECVEQYEALNDTLKKELPSLSALTERVGNICLGNFVNIQTDWYAIWKQKMRTVLGGCSSTETPDLDEVVATFQRDFPFARDQLASIGILNPTSWGRLSQSTTSMDDGATQGRGRGHSVNGDAAPTLPAPDFGGRRSGSFSLSPTSGAAALSGALSSPHRYYYRDYYAGIQAHAGTAAAAATATQPSSSVRSPQLAGSARSLAGTGTGGAASTRPSTGRSLDSGGNPRQSSESGTQQRRDSNTTYNSGVAAPHENRRLSNIFHSALPLPDGPEDSRRSSRASSRERSQTSDGYHVLWLAASLFEFNISTTKHEAGYPYLTYQAGEIFDVIAEKGELWLAKNQDDETDEVGWIWSKHFAKLADS